MVLRARWEGIHQKVGIIAGRVEILAADCNVGRGRDTAAPDLPENTLLLGFWVNRGNPFCPISCLTCCYHGHNIRHYLRERGLAKVALIEY